MTALRTNRDLHRFITGLLKEQGDNDVSLEQFLRSMLGRAQPLRDRHHLSLDEFAEIIADSFSADPLPFEATWRAQYGQLSCDDDGFEGWYATIVKQIVELREMQERGDFENEYRYYGIDPPRGFRWFNFDPACFIECAMAGSFGGRERNADSEDDRDSAPEPTSNDHATTSNSDDDSVFDMTTVDWDDFASFLYCGQSYE